MYLMRCYSSVPDEGYSSVPDEGYSSVPDGGYCSVPDGGYSINSISNSFVFFLYIERLSNEYTKVFIEGTVFGKDIVYHALKINILNQYRYIFM